MYNKIKDKALVVFSGGQDSTTCLLYAKKMYKEVFAVTFSYGQRHKTEIEAASEIAQKLSVHHKILDMSFIKNFTKNALLNDDIAIEKNDDNLPSTYVEGRNHLFFSLAAIYAKENQIHDIIVGVSETDFSGYPDCRDSFIKSLNVTLNLAMDYEFNIITPLMYLDKSEVWELAFSLGGFDLVKNETVTCYNGIKSEGCKTCPACILRNNGLEEFEKRRK